MSPEELAVEIANWAKSLGIMGTANVSPSFNDTVIVETFKGTGMQNAISILQDRKISYIGVNNEKESVVVFLEKNLRLKDQEALFKAKFQQVNIEFFHSSIAQSGSPPPPATVLPYTVNASGRYTCGSSIYIANQQGAGTLGALVSNASGVMFGLSNNHVLADSNYAEIGLPIMAPGSLDVSAYSIPPFSAGRLNSAIPLVDGHPSLVSSAHNIDAAIFELSPTGVSNLSSMQGAYYDTPTVLAAPKGNMIVEKVGRTTGLTKGEIVSFHSSPEWVRSRVSHINSTKMISFQNFWAIRSLSPQPFSSGGDSGSLITTKLPNGSRAAVGLLFAGSPDLTFMLEISPILNHFGVSLVDGFSL